MCQRTNTPPVCECQLGDLKPGVEFHTPDGEVWMVTDSPTTNDEGVTVVNLGNARGGYNQHGRNGDELKGRVTPFRANIRLGRDHRGLLYASTALNDWYFYDSDCSIYLPAPDQQRFDAVKDLLP